MKQLLLIVSCVFMLALLGGCLEGKKSSNRQARDFTVCTEEQIPEEVKQMIEEKQENAFQFTYSLQEYVYVVIGYGEQPGGGYSIRVDECSEDEKNIYVDTTLLGSEESQDHNVKSHPYIALKIIRPEKNIIFL